MVQAWNLPQQSSRSGGSIPIEGIFYHKNTSKNLTGVGVELAALCTKTKTRQAKYGSCPASSHISQGHKVFVFIVQNCIFCVVRFAGLRGGSHRKVTPLEENFTLTWGKTKICFFFTFFWARLFFVLAGRSAGSNRISSSFPC